MDRIQTQTFLNSSLRSYILDVICAFIEDRLDPDWCNVMDKPFDCISKRALGIGPEMLAAFDMDLHSTDNYDDFKEIADSFLVCVRAGSDTSGGGYRNPADDVTAPVRPAPSRPRQNWRA